MPLPLPNPSIKDQEVRRNFEELSKRFPLATELLQDGSVTTAKLAADAVTSAKIAADAVGSSEIATGAVGADEIAANAVGASEIGTLPAARVFHNAAQAITTSTLTALAFNSERFDTDIIHDTVTNNSRLIAKTAGIYSISGSVRWESVGVDITTLLSLRVNGTTFIASLRWEAQAAQVNDQSIHTHYALAVNDYVELVVFHNAAGNKNIEASSNFSPEFSMVWLSDS